ESERVLNGGGAGARGGRLHRVETGKNKEPSPPNPRVAVPEKPMEILDPAQKEIVPVRGGDTKAKSASTPCKRPTPLPDARQSQSGPVSGVVLLRCGAGKSAGCMARAVVRLRVGVTETISTAPARKGRSSSGSSLNRYAKCPLLGGKADISQTLRNVSF